MHTHKKIYHTIINKRMWLDFINPPHPTLEICSPSIVHAAAAAVDHRNQAYKSAKL
jgi:hypothetical protein